MPELKAVFLDRDGVLNECVVKNGKPYPPSSVEDFRIVPQASDACSRLKQAGFALIVITNQPDVGRGTQSVEVVAEMHRKLTDTLPLDRIYVCTHGSDDECACRKPKPGMLVQASQDLGIDLEGSFMIGDRWRDVDCGHAAGCRTVFIDYQYSEVLRTTPDIIVGDISKAADWILDQTT